MIMGYIFQRDEMITGYLQVAAGFHGGAARVINYITPDASLCSYLAPSTVVGKPPAIGDHWDL
jgi:hypothetical protein